MTLIPTALTTSYADNHDFKNLALLSPPLSLQPLLPFVFPLWTAFHLRLDEIEKGQFRRR